MALFVLAAAAAMRAAVACGGSKSDDNPGGAGTGPDAEALDGALSNDASADTGNPTVDANPPPPPSYCNGIVFYASFDKGLAADLGGGTTLPIGSAGTTTAGRFGNAASLVVDGGADGAAVFYAREDGGTSIIYPQSEGSIAFWFRHAGTASPVFSLVRPLATLPPALSAGGLFLGQTAAEFGLFRDIGGGAVLAFPSGLTHQFLRMTDFDHYVEGWRAQDDAGQNSLAILALNGGLGEVFTDAGFDAAPYADAAADEAGNVGVPYHAVTTKPWPRYPDFKALRVGGIKTTSPEGDMDDLAIWNRVLSFDEITELYRRTESIGSACKLP